MPRSRLSMGHIREVLRLRWELGLSVRATARSCGLTHPTVLKYVRRAEACGLSWPLPAEWDDTQLEWRLFPPLPPSRVPRPEPDWPTVHREMKRKGGDAAATVGRVQGGVSARLSVQWVLRALSALAGPAGRGDAPDLSRRGETGRRLCRTDGRGDRSGNRRGSARADFCRGDEGLQLHRCRGDPVAAPGGLDRLARAGDDVPGRGA